MLAQLLQQFLRFVACGAQQSEPIINLVVSRPARTSFEITETFGVKVNQIAADLEKEDASIVE